MNKPRSGAGAWASVLLADKLLSEQELASFLKVQVSEVIFDTFNWRKGSSRSGRGSRRRPPR